MLKFVGAGQQRSADRQAAALFAAIAVLLGGCAFALADHQKTPSRGRLLPLPNVSAAETVGDNRVPGPLSSHRDPASPLMPIQPDGSAAVAEPVRVSIPAIGVSARIVELGLDSSGALVPPSDVETVGWYAGGPAPGAVGPAVLAGHVDSNVGPAVFWRLRDLVAGDVVTVTGADGRLNSFRVAAVQQYAKDAFPTDQVYGIQPSPVLRLVTCGGTFDAATGHYRDNIVVYADRTTLG